MERKLAGLKPEKVFYYFEELTKIPRGSGNEQAVSNYVAEFGRARGWKVIQDKFWNVAIDVPASYGYEARKKLMLQAHLDMVCTAEDGVAFDFTSRPLDIYVEDGYIHARGTTLGADDGSGVALILALLDEEDLPHPPLRALFTTGEEVMQTGALSMSADMLDGEYLIGLDCSYDDVIFVSCAGMAVGSLEVPDVRIKVSGPEKKTVLSLMISGLQGGHSANAIHLGRVNAIQLLGEILNALRAQVPCELISAGGGSLINVIAYQAEARVCCETEAAPALEEKLTELKEQICRAYQRTEPGLEIGWIFAPANEAETVLEEKAAAAVCDLMELAPTGAFTMMDETMSLAESSANLGTLTETDGKLRLRFSIRSNKEYLMDLVIHKYEILAARCGAGFHMESRLPCWEYNPDSALMRQVERMYTECNKEAPELRKIHAGVEGAVFVDKQKRKGKPFEVVNIGCNQPDVHTPRERLQIASVGKTYTLLKKILRELE